jgi:hypothetical protein
MGNYVSRKCLLGNIVLPSTHNSGSYSWLNGGLGVRCQNKNIGEQLVGGVRVFDIRVRHQNGWIVMHHNDWCAVTGNAEERQQYAYALSQMRLFLTLCPSEFIIIFLRGAEAAANLTQQQKNDVLKMTRELLGDLLFDGKFTGDITYGQLLDMGKRVLLFIHSADFVGTMAKESRPAWTLDWHTESHAGADGKPVYVTVRNTSEDGGQSAGRAGFTDQHWLDVVRDRTNEAVWSRVRRIHRNKSPWPSGEAVFNQCDFNIWTSNIGGYAESQVNPMATRLLQKWSSDLIDQWGVNIIHVDFFNLPNTDLMDAIIQANQRKSIYC